MKNHAWVRQEKEKWHAMTQPDRAGWFDISFSCPSCGCRGHAMYKEGVVELPAVPEEVVNDATGDLVDPSGDCQEQMVETVHGR